MLRTYSRASRQAREILETLSELKETLRHQPEEQRYTAQPGAQTLGQGRQQPDHHHARATPHRRTHNSSTPLVRTSSTTPHHNLTAHNAVPSRNDHGTHTKTLPTRPHHTNSTALAQRQTATRGDSRRQKQVTGHTTMRRYAHSIMSFTNRLIGPQVCSHRASNGANRRDRVDSRRRWKN
jgi:hypothetical protein